MFSERPSQRKVVGVSRRFLAAEESRKAKEIDLYRFTHEELDFGEATSTAYALAYAIGKTILQYPIQSSRRSFLAHAQQVEGYVMGEERLEQFALNRIPHDEATRYPLTVRSNRME